MNVELLLKIKEQVLAHPEHVDMDHWVISGEGARHEHIFGIKDLRGKPEEAISCGTTACIAGWAVLLTDNPTDWKLIEPTDWKLIEPTDWKLIETVAAIELDMEKQEAGNLFYVPSWPEPFRGLYIKALDPRAKARIVADRIDHFIATGGEE